MKKFTEVVKGVGILAQAQVFISSSFRMLMVALFILLFLSSCGYSMWQSSSIDRLHQKVLAGEYELEACQIELARERRQ